MAKNKAWQGRFSEENDLDLVEFNASLNFDKRLFKEDILGSIAHASMLCDIGVLNEDELGLIKKGLLQIKDEIEKGEFKFDLINEDIHMAIEAALGEKIGEVAGKLHTARSRNDQVATDFKLYVRNALQDLQGLLKEVIQSMLDLAKCNETTIMPSFTHLQNAQPISFAFFLLSHAFALKRDILRMSQARDLASQCPLGACALAGTSYPTKREQTAKQLGFEHPQANAMDAVSDRDFALDGSYCISVMMLHLSRLCEDFIIYSSQEFSFITLSDAYSTGSSIMPQKKNPDSLELIRGKTGRCIGNLNALMITLKALPMAYNKDMQEDKEGFFDSLDTAKICLKVLNGVIKTLRVNEDAMLKACKKGHLLATDLADYLVQKKGIPFRKAHFIVGSLVAKAEEMGVDLSELKNIHEINEYFSKDANDYLDFTHSLNLKSSEGSSSIKSVKNQIKILEEFLSNPTK